jgi:CRP/FNR family transcriptional regulator
MRNLAHMNTLGRIAYALLSLLEKFGMDDEGFLNIVLSRQDLASYTGTTYETLFKMLNSLESEEILLFSDKRIKITDTVKLQMIIQGQH